MSLLAPPSGQHPADCKCQYCEDYRYDMRLEYEQHCRDLADSMEQKLEDSLSSGDHE